MNTATRVLRQPTIIVLLVLLTGCSSHSLELRLAQRYHSTQRTYQGQPFSHQVFINSAAEKNPIKQDHAHLLHVYIEGDGIPFFRATQVSADPTPSDPFMLKLMHVDNAPSIYLGRPCYFTRVDPACRPLWWTHNRYHEDVVNSMIYVLEQFQDKFDGFILMGFSGGATLAMLMAEKLQHTKAIITLAGNLNIDAWAQHHRYSPLTGSINPLSRPALPADIKQIHYAGENDNNVLAQWIKTVSDKQENAEFHLITGYNHNCCWQQLWPDVLEKLNERHSSQ